MFFFPDACVPAFPCQAYWAHRAPLICLGMVSAFDPFMPFLQGLIKHIIKG